MVRCAVNLCKCNSDDDCRKGIKFYAIPSAENRNRCNAALELASRRRALWIANLNRADLRPEDVKPWMRVCSRHFISGRPARPTHQNDVDWIPTLCLGVEAENTTNQENACPPPSSLKTGETFEETGANLDNTAASEDCEEDDGDCKSDDDSEDYPTYCLLEPGHIEHDDGIADFGEYFQNKEVHVSVVGGHPSDDLLDDSAVSGNPNNSTVNGPDMHLDETFCPVLSEDRTATDPSCSAAEENADLYDSYKKLRDHCTNLEVDKVELGKSCTESQFVIEALQNELGVLEGTVSSLKNKLSQLPDINIQQAKRLKILEVENTASKSENDKLKKYSLNIEYLMQSEDDMIFYRGLPNCKMFDTLLQFVLPRANHSNAKILSPGQSLLLTLMRLRLAVPLQDLAYRFAVSKPTASRVVDCWLHALYLSLKPLVHWPDRETLFKTMPRTFKQAFGNKVAAIIDCFEVFIDRPSSLAARAMTWSSYKHHNTVKFLIGITPGGIISFISNAWGGRSSDKHITQNCKILDNLLPYDVVLADRGFDISEDVGFCCASVVMPAFKGRRAQLSGLDVVESRKIASCRIHVERVTGLVRNKFPVLKSTLPIEYLVTREKKRTQIDEIVTVCCGLTNLCTSVVPSW